MTERHGEVWRRRVLPCVAAALLARGACAQTALSSLQGVVVDAQGAAVAAATVTVVNTDLGIKRVVHALPDGAFRASGLPPGPYTVEARGAGLKTRRPARVTLSLGSSQLLRVRVDPMEVLQTARVSGRGATVEGNTTATPPNTTEGSLSTFLPGLTVTYLPNRQRNFAQFAGFTPGSVVGDEDAGLVLNGQRSQDLLTELDGTNFSSALFGGQRGPADSTLFLPLTAIREFAVVRSGADADTESSAAGLVNAVTKSGTNRGRGEAFYTGRPGSFTAADAFGRGLRSTQNAFGGSYGGPLRRDGAFYFLSVEKDVLQAPFYAAFDPQAPGTVIPPALAAQQGPVAEQHAPLAGFGRLDFNLGPAHTLSLELGLDRVRSRNVGDGLSRSAATAAHASALTGQSVSSRAGLSSVFGRRLFNNAVLAWSSDHGNQQPNSTAPEQVVNGFGVLGGTSAGRHLYTTQRTEGRDDLTVSHGGDALTVGGHFAAEPAYEEQEFNTGGRFDYNSLADLLANRPRRFQQTFATGDVRYQGTVHRLALYADARFAVRPSLYVTAGLRWEAQWNPQPVQGNPQLSVTQHIHSDLQQLQPRAGVAWTPDARTVVRISSGLYAAPTPATFFHPVFADAGTATVTVDSDFDPSLLTLAGGDTPFPHALGAPPGAGLLPHALVRGIAPAFRNPMAAQVAASAERQILPKLDVTVGYLRNSTWGLPRVLDQNLLPPTVGPESLPVFPVARPIAGVGRLLVEESTAHSTYDGLQVAVNAPLSRRSQLMGGYTLSRTRDDDSTAGPYGPVIALNPFSPEAERGPANADARHEFNLQAILNLPAGFKLNPVFVARSGLPYTPVVGFDQQNDANDWNDRALLQGTVAPRNSLRQPAFQDADLRLVKDFTLKGEGHHLDLFADVFNVLGTANRRFGPDALDVFGDAAHPVFSAGQPLFAPGVTRFGGPRTLQFTARLVGF